MPQLREWMLHYPSDWTTPQALAYVRDVTVSLNNTIVPVVQAIGCTRTAAILMTIVTTIARANPVYHEDIKNVMANMYDLVDQLDPMKGAKLQ